MILVYVLRVIHSAAQRFTDLIFYRFLTALLQMPSTRLQLKYIVEIVTHKSANWH